mgnify:CR=1 FL=1
MNTDVTELIEYSQVLLSELSIISEQASQTNNATYLAKPKVKSCADQLRTVLDFCAIDIRSAIIGNNSSKNVYFPYGKCEESAIKNINNAFPNLERKNIAIYKLIKELQKNSEGIYWLDLLCKLNNENKHHKLSEQVKQGVKPYLSIDEEIKVGKGKLIFYPATQEDKEIEISLTSDIGKIRNRLHSKAIELKYDKYEFYVVIKGNKVPIITFYKEAIKRINKFSIALYKELEKLQSNPS